jgi:hypothetical protein
VEVARLAPLRALAGGQAVNEAIDALTNAVDEWIRRGGGTYDELQLVIESVLRRLVAGGYLQAGTSGQDHDNQEMLREP